MCHFLTISVPSRSIPDIPAEFRGHIYFSLQNNSSINRFIPKEWISFTLISGGCSCDLYRAPEEFNANETQLVRSYHKKGWSNTKIQRALESQRQTHSHAQGLRADVAELVESLVKLHGEIRLSIHWYSGDVETESFILHDSGKTSLDDLRRDATLFRSETTVGIQQ